MCYNLVERSKKVKLLDRCKSRLVKYDLTTAAARAKARRRRKMANISDSIEKFILSFFDDGDDSVQLSRNELAHYFNVSPSQINYVLTTRFGVDRGYYVESRRGGGGFIMLVRLSQDKEDLLPALVRELDETNELTFNKAADVVDRLEREDIITSAEADIIKSAISDKALQSVAVENLRKNVFREILIALIRR